MTIKMKLKKDLREFIELLNSVKVKYLIVGGYAVAFHGYPRLTGDIDVFVEVSESNAQRIMEVIRQFGFAETGITDEDFLKPDSVVQLGVPPNRIDLITTLDAVDFKDAWGERVDSDLDGTPVHYISKQDLLKNKAAVGRPKDIADIEEIGD